MTKGPENYLLDQRYRIHRHVVCWIAHVIVFSIVGYSSVPRVNEVIITSIIAVPLYMIYLYPAMYGIVPRYLIREKYISFLVAMTLWVCFGLFLNFAYRAFVLLPFRHEWAAKVAPYKSLDTQQFAFNYKNVFAFGSFFAMNAMLGFGCMIKMFQFWVRKQRDMMQLEKEKVTAELQLLKAQVHPHFLFNTLNNIYSYALEQSPKTPQLVMKLSSLLSYILYECKHDKVLLEKEIAVLRDYIDLEKERYGNKLELSLNFEGDIPGKRIAPLLFLPFVENAFKHGTSAQLEKPWLSIDISVKGNRLKCKIINSKGDGHPDSSAKGGIGISNVQKRLALLYPNKHTLSWTDEPDYFAVSLLLDIEEIVHPAQMQAEGASVHPPALNKAI